MTASLHDQSNAAKIRGTLTPYIRTASPAGNSTDHGADMMLSESHSTAKSESRKQVGAELFTYSKQSHGARARKPSDETGTKLRNVAARTYGRAAIAVPRQHRAAANIVTTSARGNVIAAHS